jgi:hypothetical protein
MNERTQDEQKQYYTNVIRNSASFLNNLSDIERKLGLKFPSQYAEFIKADGLSGYTNDKFELYLYDEQDIDEFNIGDSRFEEMKEYLLFGQDGGSNTYFFDPDNILNMGNEAVYRVARSAVDKSAFTLLANDFKEFFNLMIANKELNEEYTFNY